MNVRLCTTRWGTAATAAFTTAAMCGSATPAQAVVGQGAPAQSHAMAAATTGGFSGSRWGDPTADSMSQDAYGMHQAAKDLVRGSGSLGPATTGCLPPTDSALRAGPLPAGAMPAGIPRAGPRRAGAALTGHRG